MLHRWLHFVSLGSDVADFLHFWDPWGLTLRPLGSIWTPFGPILVSFSSSGSGPWTPCATFLEKVRKRCKKKQKKGVGMNAFSLEFQVFLENGKVCFDCAGASGLGFIALIFCLFAVTFASSFCHRFCMLFGSTWEPRFTRP